MKRMVGDKMRNVEGVGATYCMCCVVMCGRFVLVFSIFRYTMMCVVLDARCTFCLKMSRIEERGGEQYSCFLFGSGGFRTGW